jgi:hypothetical protein
MWGEPAAGCPSVSRLSTTLTGDSSAPSTGSARNERFIASSNPASSRMSASRCWARATNPVDTGASNSASISCAVASTGTLPCEPSRIVAALIRGP